MRVLHETFKVYIHNRPMVRFETIVDPNGTAFTYEGLTLGNRNVAVRDAAGKLSSVPLSFFPDIVVRAS